jgi:hypothetical protein
VGRGASNSSAPYFIAMREYERRMLIAAIDSCGSISIAASALGVTKEYVRLRALHLGGVLAGQDKREPPGPIAGTRPKVRAEGYGLKRNPKRKPRLTLVPDPLEQKDPER